MDKWNTLKLWLEVHASVESDLNTRIILEYMENLEKEEKKFQEQLSREPKQEEFLFIGVPSFDQKAWDKILEEKGLQGLA
jgi:hypothetical protein